MTTLAVSSQPQGKTPFLAPLPPNKITVPAKTYSLPEIFHSNQDSEFRALAERVITRLFAESDSENKENEQGRFQAELISTFHPLILNPAIQREVRYVYFRGCSAKQFIEMIKEKSAGGVPASKMPVLPTEDAVRKQIAGDNPKDRLPEFTKKYEIAHDFSKDNYFTVWTIDSKHLVRGSIAEDGYICSKDTPVRILAWTKGPSLIEREITSQ